MSGIVTIDGPDGPIKVNWDGEKPPTPEDVDFMLGEWKKQRPAPGLLEGAGILAKHTVSGIVNPLVGFVKGAVTHPIDTLSAIVEGTPEARAETVAGLKGITSAQDQAAHNQKIKPDGTPSPELDQALLMAMADRPTGFDTDLEALKRVQETPRLHSTTVPVLQPMLESVFASTNEPTRRAISSAKAGDTRGALEGSGDAAGALILSMLPKIATKVGPVASVAAKEKVLPFVSKTASKTAEAVKKVPGGLVEGAAKKSIDFLPIGGLGRAGVRALLEQYLENKSNKTTAAKPTGASTPATTASGMDGIFSAVEKMSPEAADILRKAVANVEKEGTATTATESAPKPVIDVAVGDKLKGGHEVTGVTKLDKGKLKIDYRKPDGKSATITIDNAGQLTVEKPAASKPADAAPKPTTPVAKPTEAPKPKSIAEKYAPEPAPKIKASELKAGDLVPGMGHINKIRPRRNGILEVEFSRPSGRVHTKLVKADSEVQAFKQEKFSGEYPENPQSPLERLVPTAEEIQALEDQRYAKAKAQETKPEESTALEKSKESEPGSDYGARHMFQRFADSTLDEGVVPESTLGRLLNDVIDVELKPLDEAGSTPVKSGMLKEGASTEAAAAPTSLEQLLKHVKAVEKAKPGGGLAELQRLVKKATAESPSKVETLEQMLAETIKRERKSMGSGKPAKKSAILPDGERGWGKPKGAPKPPKKSVGGHSYSSYGSGDAPSVPKPGSHAEVPQTPADLERLLLQTIAQNAARGK